MPDFGVRTIKAKNNIVQCFEIIRTFPDKILETVDYIEEYILNGYVTIQVLTA
jgi:hypothetical protein